MKKRLLIKSLPLLLIFSLIALPCSLKTSSLSIADQKKIAQFVLEQGQQDSKPSPADNCSTYLHNDLKVIFLSAQNLPAQFKPRLPGFHIVIESEKEIEQNIQNNKRHCWIKLGKVIASGKEVAATFTKKIETQSHPQGIRYIFEEMLHYACTQAKGKWTCALKQRSKLES